MKTKGSAIFLLLVCQILLASCTTTKDEPKLDNVEASNINNQIHAKVYELGNTFETVNPVILGIQSFTNNTIVFKNNFNVRIFEKSEKGWKEIKEKPVTRLPEDDVFFSGKGTLRVFSAFPKLSDYTHNITLRIYVVGDMQTDQGTTKVAAYTDVTLHP